MQTVKLLQPLLIALGHHIGTAETDTGADGRQTKAAVAAWQHANKLPATGKLDPASLELLMQQGRALTRVVRGVVALADGTLVSGLRVTAHDVDFRAEELLGEAHTDAQGRYTIEYTLLKAARAEKNAADIAISIFRPRGRTPINPPAPGTTRPVLMNAPIEAEINVTIALADSGLPSEFERIAADLRPLIGKVPFADIAHNRDAEEGLFLSRETGISLDRVAHFTVAHRMADASKLPATYLYALLREDGLFGIAPGRIRAVSTPVGFATDTQAVLHEAALLDAKAAKAAVDRAIRKNIVPAATRKELKPALTALEKQRPAAERFAKLERPRQIFGAIENLIDAGKMPEMLALLNANDPHDLPALYAKLDASNAIAAGKKAKVKSNLHLAELLGFNAGLVDEVSASMGVDTPAAVRDLAKLNRKEWSATLKSSKSLTVGGAPVAPALARRQASAIVRRFEKEFPTTAFAAQLARRQPLHIGGLSDVVDLLEAHPEFALERHNLLPFLADAGVDVAALPQSVIDQTNQLQRVFVLTGNYSKTESLIAAGFGASADIVAVGKTQFVAEAKAAAGIEQTEAERIFAQAETTNMAAITFATNLRMSGSLSLASTALPSTATALQPVGGIQPDLQSLFFTDDCCECDHANSIYGPAAYFADVMGFLKNRLVRGGVRGKAKDVLFERRPELGDIDLNGTNAETPVPHIDIVCELLEEAVSSSPVYPFSGALLTGLVPHRIVSPALIAAVATEGYAISSVAEIYGPHGLGLDEYVLRDAGITVAIKQNGTNWHWRIMRQTHGTPEERAAAPEYLNQGAYNVLADPSSKAAFLLPFDLTHAETRAYLNAAGVDRAELMEAFQVSGAPSDAAIDAELLGLSASDRTSIFVADPTSQPQIWGVVAWEDMQRLDVFSNKTGLDFPAIERLISLKFIRSSVNLYIRHNDNSCDLEKKEIVNLDEHVLDRIHRVMRLSRKTGLSIRDIDRLAAAPKLGNDHLDLACLSALAELLRISRKIDVDIPDLVTWLDVIPQDGSPSQHAKLFENPAITGPISSLLSANDMANNTSPPPLSDPDIVGSIARALRMAEADVSSLIATHPWGLAVSLDFATLGEIFGRIQIANRLRLSVSNLLALEAMLPQAALANASGLRAFIENEAVIQGAGVSAGDLKNLLQPSVADLAARDAADQAGIATGLTKLRDELVKAKALNSPAEISLSWLEMYLDGLLTQAVPLIDSSDVASLLKVVRDQIVLPSDAPAVTGAVLTSLTKLQITMADKMAAAALVADVYNSASPDYRAIANFRYQELLRQILPPVRIAEAVLDVANSDAITALDGQLHQLPALNDADITALTSLPNLPSPTLAEIALADAALAKAGAAIALLPLTNNFAPPLIVSPSNPTIQEIRFAFLTQAILTISARVNSEARKSCVLQATSEFTKWTASQASLLLGDGSGLQPSILLGSSPVGSVLDNIDVICANGLAVSPATATDQFRSVRLLNATARMLSPFNPSQEALGTLLHHSGALGWLELGTIPFEAASATIALAAWRTVANSFTLSSDRIARLDPADPSLAISVWSTFSALAVTSDKVEFLRQFAVLNGYPQQDVVNVDGVLGTPVTAYFEPDAWLSLDYAVTLSRKLDAPLSDILGYTQDALQPADRISAQAMLRRQYSSSDWLNTLKVIMDPVRERKRDALVAYLMAQNSLLLSKADLYDYFLTDTEWSAKMPSSRIVHAHGTVQLFILRCLSGLEPDAIADTDVDPDWKQWDWMRNYRVWEVNRKVFVEPQYYIRPEWRDDKTELFDAFEGALQQNEINQENVNAAFEGYLDSLDQIAFMDVLTTCYDLQLDNMHVFAVTKGGEPRQYYHCMLQRERIWTPWEKIDLDITGDHLVAFHRDGRLSLAWLNFLEKGDENQDVLYPQQNDKMVKPDRYTEMRLAVSEYTGKRWLPRREAAEALATEPVAVPLERKDIQLIVNTEDTWFAIQVYHANQVKIDRLGNKIPLDPLLLGYFELAGCKGYPEVHREDPTQPKYALIAPVVRDGIIKGQRYIEQNKDSDDRFEIYGIDRSGHFPDILHRTPGNFRITYPFQVGLVDKIMTNVWLSHNKLIRYSGMLRSFFYEDNMRGYIFTPLWTSVKLSEHIGGKYYTFYSYNKSIFDILYFFNNYNKRLKIIEEIVDRKLRELEQEKLESELYKNTNNLVSLLISYLDLIKVQNFYHPMLCDLRKGYFSGGVKKMLSRSSQLAEGPFVFEHQSEGYAPSSIVQAPYPKQELEFGRDRVYGTYNWELTFHIPFMIADKLMADGKFEDAEDWLRLIFDPLDSSNEPTPNKYWNTKPFFERTQADYRSQLIGSVMNRITADPTGAVDLEMADTILDWRRNPFKPYLVARGRTVAFQQATVFKMIKLFIEQGDSFFRRDQLEDLVTAGLYYSRAERLLGARPKVVPASVKVPPETYNQLASKLDLFGNALRNIENLVPNLDTLPQGGDELPPPPLALSSLYFCIPPSEKLFELWDLLEERQYNLRNSRNIDGVERSLSLFAPPLSVEAMLQAAAGGLSASDILASMSAPRPPYRFRVMLRHAIELSDIASGFSREMEQALSSRDGESLTRLKMEHEIRLQNEQVHMMKEEIAAAGQTIESAKRGRTIHTENRDFYLSRPYMTPLEIASTGLDAVALLMQPGIAVGHIAAAICSIIPTMTFGGAGVGGSPQFNIETGGGSISSMTRDFLGATSTIAGMMSQLGGMVGKQASFLERQKEWGHSTRLAELELARSDVEITIAGIREGIAKEQLRLHGIKQQQLTAEDSFVRSKFTNRELFDWLSQQLRGLSRQMYNLAFEAAKAAENCFNFELGTTDSFVRSGQWNENRKGLLAASNLVADLRKMESSHLKRNVREREMTKHISAARLDPFALYQLRTTGSCTINVPEALFDMEHPGHYFRRIKAFSVTVPCVAGPYSSMPLKVTQVSNRIRVSKTNAANYTEDDAGDARFRYNVGSVQSIETSKGEDDSGLFSLNLDDERYLPFEGSGAIGTYQLELPKDVRGFDYATISDVIFHMRYTARDGGGTFRDAVSKKIKEQLNAIALQGGKEGLFHAIDIRRDRPAIWHQLKTTGTSSLTLTLDDFPYFAASAGITLPASDGTIAIAKYSATSLIANGQSVTNGLPGTAIATGSQNPLGIDVPIPLSLTMLPNDTDPIQELAIIFNYVLT
jgi:Tc toxin complex TcA C-terminal TcB-binding domain/Neuraminidase-like domain/Putative peptidoglycan binding domain